VVANSYEKGILIKVVHSMKKLIAIILLFTLNSCYLFKENGIDVEIINKSDSAITNVKFTTSERLEFIEIEKIEPNESISEFLSMKYNKRDGGYSLEFNRADGKKEKSGGGYYTNGGSLDRWVKFEIQSDTIFVEFSGTGY